MVVLRRARIACALARGLGRALGDAWDEAARGSAVTTGRRCVLSPTFTYSMAGRFRRDHEK